MNKICILLSKEHLELSAAEIRSIFEQKGELDNNILFLNISLDLNQIKKKLSKLAYSKKAFICISQTKNIDESIPSLVEFMNQNKTAKSFKITSIGLNDKKIDFEPFADAILKNNESISVNLSNPDLNIFIINGKYLYLTSLFWENNENFSQRNPSKRPATHPTSMDPRLARCLINLANPKKEVFDPFCGAAGILIEAGLMGYNAKGIDIDFLMIQRAKVNLNHFLDNNFVVEKYDALQYTKPAECVVTDIPYGKSSKLKQSLDSLLKEFLSKYTNITKKMVLVSPKSSKIDKIAVKYGWKVTFSYEFYIHTSLTRRIVVLEL